MLVWQAVLSYSAIKQHHHVRRARIEFSLTPCSLSKAQIAIYQISFWLFLTPNSPALWGKKSMGIIPNILQKYQGQPFSVMSFLLLIKLFQSLKWEGLIVSQLILWQELHCNLILNIVLPIRTSWWSNLHVNDSSCPILLGTISENLTSSTILNIWSHFGKNKTVLICPPPAGKSNQNSELLRSFVSSVGSVMASIDPDPSFLRN